ncbi:hypothetical protein [Micromonospora sp. NPDC047527]|uniref:hypothetical protein n=1 Tax=unclassified Micromonospora TaxID=2617518 RepID=UPI0033E61776
MSALRRAEPRRLLTVLLALALTTAGCGSNGGTPSGSGPTGVAGRTAAPNQPFDALLGEEYSSVELARLRIRDKCLADAGYPQNRDNFSTWRPPDPFEPLLLSAQNLGPTSEQEARRLGFGADFPGEPARIVSLDAGYDTNLKRCEAEAWTRFGPKAKQTMTDYFDLFNVLGPYRYEVEREMPSDLASKLYDCMATKNYRADRDAFLRTPNYTLFGVQFGASERGPEEDWQPASRPGVVQVGPAIPARRYVPTPAESDLAVAWFQCSKDVGRVEAHLAAAFRVQQRYVDRYESRITELNEQIKTLARQSAGLLAQN